ncbi:hypothetical protein N0V88_005967 [Collariella sp. IMI 366227]|nr:hypothetical protein N0V88_005967 [Collariella sp. IMI 366227]
MSAQIAAWGGVKRPGSTEDGKDVDDKLYIAQWLLTPYGWTSSSLGLNAIAVLPTNPALRQLHHARNVPNVLMVDYVGVVTVNDHNWADLSAELYTLAVGLNLFTLSDNYEIDKNRPPLLPSDGTTYRTAGGSNSTTGKPLFEPWTGVIFANGTKLDQTPEWFSLGGPLVTVNGVSFHNTSVLTTNSNNTNPLANPARFARPGQNSTRRGYRI